VLVTFGVAGGQFSFGVFLKPMTEEFGWSRATLSLAFATTFMLSGLLRPLAGYLADRYSPKIAVLSGVAVMGAMLLVIPFIQNLAQLFVIFAIMIIGVVLKLGVIRARLQKQHRPVGVFGQPGSYHATGGTGAYDNHIVLHVFPPILADYELIPACGRRGIVPGSTTIS